MSPHFFQKSCKRKTNGCQRIFHTSNFKANVEFVKDNEREPVHDWRSELEGIKARPHQKRVRVHVFFWHLPKQDRVGFVFAATRIQCGHNNRISKVQKHRVAFTCCERERARCGRALIGQKIVIFRPEKVCSNFQVFQIQWEPCCVLPLTQRAPLRLTLMSLKLFSLSISSALGASSLWANWKTLWRSWS